jgi:thiamine-phosphate pyrophosphorylase
VIVYTTPDILQKETTLINRFFEEGLEILHLRKPDASETEIRKVIECIKSKYHSKIMIHNHYALADEYGLRGIHFTEKTKPIIHEYREKPFHKSMAVHVLQELNKVPSGIEYVTLSPIFPSISKEEYHKSWNYVEMLNVLKLKRDYKIVALGGVTLKNLVIVRELGFANYAVLGSIWEQFGADSDVKKVVEIFKSFQNEKSA